MNPRRPRLILATLLGTALIASACAKSSVPSAEEPAVVEEIEGSELSRITLSARAAERLGIATEPVLEAGQGRADLLAIPYAAVLYDADGKTWAYASSGQNLFIRHEIVVDRIEGDLAYLVTGPPAGTQVVTTGAAELYGTETGVGGGH